MMSTPSISACGFRSMISRSLKVPGSDSSAFTHRYAGRRSLAEERRLAAGREAGAAPSAKPRRVDLGDDVARSIVSARFSDA